MNNFNFTDEELAGLPAELLRELRLKQKTKQLNTESNIMSIFKKYGPELSTDHVIVYYYKETGTVYKRNYIAARLYKLAGTGHLQKIKSVTGCFKLPDDGE